MEKVATGRRVSTTIKLNEYSFYLKKNNNTVRSSDKLGKLIHNKVGILCLRFFITAVLGKPLF